MLSRRQSLGLGLGLVLVIAMVGLRWPGFGQPHWGIDEGVTFTIAQQLAEGDVLYRDAVDHRTPLVPYLKAIIFLVAGDWNTWAVRCVVAAMLGLTAVLLWRIGRRLGDEATGVASALISIPAMHLLIGLPDGPAANTAWFVIFFSSIGFWCFARAIGRPGFAVGLPVGFAFGLSALCKQPALLDFGVTWVIITLAALRQPEDRRALARLFGGQLLGAALPVVGFAATYAAQGAWSNFVYYAFTYNTAVYIPAGGDIDYLQAMAEPFRLARQHVPTINVLALAGGLGLLATAVSRLFRRGPLDVLPWLILGWTATGILSTGLSGRTFAHYSVQVLPGLSLAAGWTVAQFYQIARRSDWPRWLGRLSLAATTVAIVVSATPRAVTQFKLTQTWESQNVPTGELLARFSAPTERIFVWGYFPEYHLMAQRLPATRFVYSNFLTGLVPWSEMDAFISTDRWISPGAWDQFRTDFADHPPALIADQEQDRAQAKYPLSDHDWVWHQITRHYAEVACTALPGMTRFYRRLDATPVPLDNPSSLAVDPTLQLAVGVTLRRHEPDSLQLRAGAGWRHFSVWVGENVVMSLPHSAGDEVAVNLWNTSQVFSDSEAVRVVGQRTDGTLATSAPLAYRSALAEAQRQRGPLPLLQLNGVPTAPIEASMATADLPINHEQVPGTVTWAAPGRLVYPCAPSVRRLNLVHGLHPHLYNLSDGYDLLLNWLPDDGGAPIELWRKRVAVLEEGRFRSTQHDVVDLPARGPGKLEVLFLTGRRSNRQLDFLFFGDDSPTQPMPRIYVDDQPVAAARDLLDDDVTRWMRNAVNGWLLHAPGQIEWDLPSHLLLRDVTFSYGIEDGAWQPGGGETDGVTFTVNFRADENAEPIELFSRHVAPRNNEADRGQQTSTFTLPAQVGGLLSIETTEGPHGNGAWDWSWISDLTATRAATQP